MPHVSALAEKEFTVFLVRPWHNANSSLYPPIMDGVEYINEAIHIIKRFLGPKGFEVRVDEDVFVPGLTLRQNLHREIFDADLVLTLLDGLRPNVVYELGFAYGWHQLRTKSKVDSEEAGASESPTIVCLAERNATVLVRNFYPEPLSVPTINGEVATILNPKLDICRMFSDNSDILVSYYDRLNLVGSLEKELSRLVASLRGSSSKQSFVRSIEDETPPADVPQQHGGPATQQANDAKSWELYGQQKYLEVVNYLQNPETFDQRKVLALSLMRLGRLYEAIGVWKQLLENAGERIGGVLLHLGICFYAVGQLSTAAEYFAWARDAGDQRAIEYLERIRKKRRADWRPPTPPEGGGEQA